MRASMSIGMIRTGHKWRGIAYTDGLKDEHGGHWKKARIGTCFSYLNRSHVVARQRWPDSFTH